MSQNLPGFIGHSLRGIVLFAALGLLAACRPPAPEMAPVPSPVRTAPLLASATPSATPPLIATAASTTVVVPTPGATLAALPTLAAATGTLLPLPSPDDVVALARADLAGRLNVALSSIELVALESAELPLPDLGCPSTPEPSAAPVIPALVAGQVLRLRAGGVEYEYRAHARRLVFCGPVQ